MSLGTNVRLTLAAALATALAALTLFPVFEQQSWLWAALLAVAVVAGVGVVGRALRVPRPLVLLLQLLALVAAVSARFAPSESTWGVIPTADTVAVLRDLLDRGFAAINDQAVPVFDVPGIALIAMLGVGAVAVAVDLTAVALRSPVIAGVPLLGLYVVPSAVLPTSAPWDLFAAAAAAWLLLVYLDHRAETRDWGTRISPEPTGRAEWVSNPLRPHAVLGRRIAFAAVAGALLVSALPLVGDGVVGDIGSSGRGGERDGTGRTVTPVTLDLGVTLKNALSSDLDLPVLSYSSEEGTGQYLRLTVLDTFDGISWQPAPQPVRGPSIFAGSQDVPGLDENRAAVRQVRTEVLTFDTVANVGYLPMPYTATEVDVTRTRGEWQWDRLTSTVFSENDEFAGKQYAVDAATVTPSPALLAATTVDASDVAGQLTVPADLPPELVTTAESVTAGETTAYGQAVALQRFFRDNFVYDLDIPATDDAEALTTFLTNRRGFCQQFAATYALMARAVGVPSRVVVGFAPGSRDDLTGSYLVGTHDYHAWPEVFFDGVGWVRFEPTPRTGEDSTLAVPSWAASGADLGTDQAPEIEQPTRPDRDVQPESTDPSNTSANDTDVTRVWTWSGPARVAGVVGLVLVLLLAAGGPAWARSLRRRRRGRAPDGRARIEAAWAELGDTARDLGIAWADDDTPRRSADALVRDAGLGPAGSGGVQTLRLGIERARYADTDSSGTGSAIGTTDAALTAALQDLDAVSSRGARLRARLLPRSVWKR